MMDEPITPLHVRDVLGFEAMEGAKVLAGESGLERPITGALIVEVPEVSQWIQGGELLLSAAYPWRDDPQRLAELVALLDDAGAHGIVFKPGPYLQRVPDQALRVADEREFPVLEIPSDVPYRDILEPLYERLTAQRVASTRGLEELNALTRLSLDEHAIQRVTLDLAAQLDRPVFLVDLVEDVLVEGLPTGSSSRRSIADLDEPLAQLVTAVSDQRMPRTANLAELGGRPVLAAGLVVGHEYRGCILIDTAKDEKELEDDVSDPLTRSAEIASFLLLRRLAVLEGRRQAATLFFSSLMHDTLTNEEAAERALGLGLRLTRPLTAFAVGSGTQVIPTPLRESLRRKLNQLLAQIPHVVTADHESHMLLALMEAGDLPTDEFFPSLLDGLQETLGGTRSLVAGVGRPATGLTGVRRSRSEAMMAYSTAVATDRDGLVQFGELGVERLLAQVALEPLAADYVASALGSLGEDPKLLHTLEVYLQNGGNKVATAAAIPLHRSSLMYRLGKLGELLDADLNDAEACQELWLALRLRRILKYSGAPTPGQNGSTPQHEVAEPR